MAQEIERKYLLTGDGWKDLAEGVHYRQGYLSTVKERTVRVRTIGEKPHTSRPRLDPSERNLRDWVGRAGRPLPQWARLKIVAVGVPACRAARLSGCVFELPRTLKIREVS